MEIPQGDINTNLITSTITSISHAHAESYCNIPSRVIPHDAQVVDQKPHLSPKPHRATRHPPVQAKPIAILSLAPSRIKIAHHSQENLYEIRSTTAWRLRI